MDFSHFPDELLMLLRQVPGKRELRGHKLSEDDLAKKRSRAFASEMFMNEKPRKPNSEEVKSSDHAVASDVLLPLYDELSRYVASGARIHLELEAPRGPEFFQAAVKVRIEELEWDGANHDRFIIHLTELLSLDGDPASKKMVQLIAKGRIVVVANKPKEGEFAVIAHSSLSGEARLPVPNEQARSENREAGDAKIGRAHV